MSKAKVGAKVIYCGHDGYFIADIYKIEGVNVVRANGKVTPGNLVRPVDGATHQMCDCPVAGFWRPDLGRRTWFSPRQWEIITKISEKIL